MKSAASSQAALQPQHAVPETEVLRLLDQRGSVRNYKPDPVPEPWVEAILAAGQRAPTSSNVQAYSIVVVRDPRKKARLAELAGNQQHIIDCPVFFALCADQRRLELACAQHGVAYQGQTVEQFLVASIDVALLGMSMSLAADSLGLGTVMIGGMRNQPLAVAELLELPQKVYTVFGLCLGFPKSAPLPKPRQALGAVVHQERYDEAAVAEAVRAYDASLAEHYRDQGRESPDAAWTQPMAEKFSKVLRGKLRAELKTQGFDLE